MSDNVKECEEKFFRLLQLTKPNSVFHDDTFQEKIFTYLKNEEYAEVIKDLRTIAWLEDIIEAFNKDPQQVSNFNFTLKILCLLCRNEWNFVSINEKGVLDKIQCMIQQNPQLQKASIKLSHLKLLREISQHPIGLQWLKQKKSWNTVFEYNQKSTTVYITKEASGFFYDILTKFIELMNDEETAIEVLEMIAGPILNYRKRPENYELLPVDHENLSIEIIPSVNVLTQILWMCVEAKKRSRIAYYILLKYRYENTLWVIQDVIVCDTQSITAIARGLIVSNFARLSNMDIPASDEKGKDLHFDVHALHFYNLINFCYIRRVYKCINMVCEAHHQLWAIIDDETAMKEVVLKNHDLKYGDQVIMIQTFPIVYVINSMYKNDDSINDFLTKLFHMSCEHTVRILYHLRDGFSRESFDYAADLATSAIHSLTAVKKYLKRERAILTFQILVYVLKGYVSDDAGEGRSSAKSNVQLVLQAPNLLSALLNSINELIKYFKFNWKECVESTSVVPLLLALLENTNLSSRHTVESLKLIQTSIEHFLAPNLALLMDQVDGSGMENLGPTIFRHMHSLSWEVRDSVLELLYSMVEISDKKFPPFQKHLLQHNICSNVEIIAKNDSEPYVRASAFKVLGAMVKIRLFWGSVLHEMDVKKYALEVLGNESEGVVRREAVACLAQIYKHREISEQSLDVVFSVLAHCAVNDFYWEVKVNALNFWNLVIDRQFEYQGMINGSFPSQTFSKEKKKIVTLNEKEIQLRLHKILNELSLRGCLGILITCLQDSDLQVIKKVVAVVENMMAHFVKYNFIEEYKRMKQKEGETSSFRPVVDSHYSEVKSMYESVANVETQVRNAGDFSKTTEVTVSEENGKICSDSILDSIRNTDDITLLSNTYKENLSIKQEPCNMGKIEEDLFKKFASVSPNDFLNFVDNTNWNEILKEKSDWLHHTETFSTLLDDILQSFGYNVDLDCY